MTKSKVGIGDHRRCGSSTDVGRRLRGTLVGERLAGRLVGTAIGIHVASKLQRRLEWAVGMAVGWQSRKMRTRDLYVICLDDALLEVSKFRTKNASCQRGKPCAYVGESGLEPEIRFRRQKTGRNASGFPRRCSLHLLEDVYEHLNPVRATESEDRERRLAEALRREGWGVVGWAVLRP